MLSKFYFAISNGSRNDVFVNMLFNKEDNILMKNLYPLKGFTRQASEIFGGC